MKTLRHSILPAIGLALAMLDTSSAGISVAPAVQSYTYSNNQVRVEENIQVGGLNYITAEGLLFTGTYLVPSNANFVKNEGIIISGTGVGILGTAGILFDASAFGSGTGGISNANAVINRGAIITVSGNSLFNSNGAGIMFLAIGNGDSNYNLVNNEGWIQVVVSGSAAGIGFASENATSANNNLVINNGTINVVSTMHTAYGIGFDGQYLGDSSNNIVVNNGRLFVSAPQEAYGMAFTGWDQGNVNRNIVTNNGLIIVSSTSAARGIYFNGGGYPYGGNANNNVVTNQGSIIVLTTTGLGTTTGIEFDGGSYPYTGNVNNNLITNWGTINVGPGGSAILITNGNNNVVSLNGHSSLNGLIAATGSNNVLKIAFSGISSHAANLLRAELGTALNGLPSSGTFTVRGVTYTYGSLIAELATSSYQQQGKTPNQKAIGANLDSFKVNPTGDMFKLLTALDQSGNVPRGLEQLSPQRYQVYTDIALANANLLTQEIDRRLNNLRTGSESFDSNGLGISSGIAQSKLGMSDHKQAMGIATMSRDGKSVDLKDTAPESKRWGAFISGDIIFADLDGRNIWQQDGNFTTGGLIAGLDAKVTDSLTAGLLLGYSHTDANLDSQNSNTYVDTYSAGAYGGYYEGNFYGNGLLAYLYNNYDSNRTVSFPGISRTANGHAAGSQFVLNLDGGYDHPVCKDVTVGPFAGIEYVNLGVGSFTENGAGSANLAINKQDVNSLRSRLGVRMEVRKELTANWVAASEVRAAWQYEFLDDNRAIVARFSDSGLGAFSVRTDNPERNAALVGIGINATYRNMLTTFVDYDVQVGQAHYVEQSIKGGFKWSF